MNKEHFVEPWEFIIFRSYATIMFFILVTNPVLIQPSNLEHPDDKAFIPLISHDTRELKSCLDSNNQNNTRHTYVVNQWDVCRTFCSWLALKYLRWYDKVDSCGKENKDWTQIIKNKTRLNTACIGETQEMDIFPLFRFAKQTSPTGTSNNVACVETMVEIVAYSLWFMRKAK